MCGLFGGFSTVLMPHERDLIAGLGVMNFFRGKDSAGHFDYMTSPPGKEAKCIWNRSTDSVLDYIQEEWPEEETRRWSKGGGMRLIAGHARAATKGVISEANAHPFNHGSIIGMHNGTIHGNFENSSKFETDSEALIFNISERGVEDAILEANKSANQIAYALVWVNCKDETLNFLRNGMRTLSYATSDKNKGIMFWNSEMLPMSYVLGRDDPTKWKINAFALDTHYSWKISQGPIKEPVRTEIKPKPKVYAIGSDQWPSEKKEVETVQPGLFRTGGGAHNRATPVERNWILQYSAQHKTPFYKYYDAITNKYFSEWSWKRLSDSRMYSEMATSGSAVGTGGVSRSDPCSNDNSTVVKPPSELNDTPFDNYENALTTLVWTVYKDKIVSYADWLKATRAGCCYCSKTLVSNSEVYWVGSNEPLCVDCCSHSLNPMKDQFQFFEHHADEIKKFLKDYPENYKEEIAEHNKALKSEDDKEYAE